MAASSGPAGPGSEPDLQRKAVALPLCHGRLGGNGSKQGRAYPPIQTPSPNAPCVLPTLEQPSPANNRGYRIAPMSTSLPAPEMAAAATRRTLPMTCCQPGRSGAPSSVPRLRNPPWRAAVNARLVELVKAAEAGAGPWDAAVRERQAAAWGDQAAGPGESVLRGGDFGASADWDFCGGAVAGAGGAGA